MNYSGASTSIFSYIKIQITEIITFQELPVIREHHVLRLLESKLQGCIKGKC